MVAFRNDNQHLVSGGADQLIKLWKARRQRSQGAANLPWPQGLGHRRRVQQGWASRRLVQRRSQGEDLGDHEPRHSGPRRAHEQGRDRAVSPDGKIIATGSRDRSIKLWGPRNRRRDRYPHRSEFLRHVARFHPRQQALISSGSDASIRLWDVSPPREIPAHAGAMTGFNRLLSGLPLYRGRSNGEDSVRLARLQDARKSIKIEAYDIDTGNQLFSALEDSRKVHSLAFCADGQLAATGAEDGSVRLWEMKKGVANIAPGGDCSSSTKVGVADLALTPDGKTLIATSNEGKSRSPRSNGREVLKTFKGHAGPIQVCMSSADGKTLRHCGGRQHGQSLGHRHRQGTAPLGPRQASGAARRQPRLHTGRQTAGHRECEYHDLRVGFT